MAGTRYAYVKYDSTGAANYVVPFTYISEAYVHVFVDGLETNDYIWESPSNIRFNTVIPVGHEIEIVRSTEIVDRLVDYNNKTKFLATDLDLDSQQAFDLIQEIDDRSTNTSEKVDELEQLIIDSGMGSGAGGEFDVDFTVLGVDQGVYSDGNVIPARTPILDVVKNMLTKIIPPVYTAPTLSLTGSGNKTIEAGTTITPTMTPSFSQNDAGVSAQYDLFRDSISIFTDINPSAQNGGPVFVGDGSVAFRAEVQYNDGPIKNDNAGNPYPTGQILAGTVVSGNVTYTGRRKAFYQIDGDTVDIRSNANSLLGAVNGSTFSTSGTGNTLVVSYPATLRDLTNVTLTSSGFSFDITGEMVARPNQLVNDASGANPISYKVFEYTPASSFTAADFDITI